MSTSGPPDAERLAREVRRLGRAIGQRRDELGLSPEELARRTGLTEARVAAIEAGTAVALLDELVDLSAALELRTSELFARAARLGDA